MNARSRQRIQVPGQRRGQRLALPGPHLSDLAPVQHGPADDLHVEWTPAQCPGGRLTDGRERLRQQVIQGLAASQPGPEDSGQGTKRVVRARLHLRPQRIDLHCYLTAPFQNLFAIQARAKGVIRRPVQQLHDCLLNPVCGIP
jgi:hypothetical protein